LRACVDMAGSPGRSVGTGGPGGQGAYIREAVRARSPWAMDKTARELGYVEFRQDGRAAPMAARGPYPCRTRTSVTLLSWETKPSSRNLRGLRSHLSHSTLQDGSTIRVNR